MSNLKEVFTKKIPVFREADLDVINKFLGDRAGTQEGLIALDDLVQTTSVRLFEAMPAKLHSPFFALVETKIVAKNNGELLVADVKMLRGSIPSWVDTNPMTNFITHIAEHLECGKTFTLILAVAFFKDKHLGSKTQILNAPLVINN